MSKPLRVLGYTRVSTVDQSVHGTSLPAQREELEHFCAARGYPAPTIFVETESGSAAREEQRVQQRALMEGVSAGDLVLVSKQDRWSRDTLHFLRSVDAILAKGARFLSIAEQFDPSTSAGRYVSTIMAATAEQERARIRERTQGARQRLRELGCWIEGEPPVGYLVENRKLVVDPDRSREVLRMFELCIAGHSTRAMAMWLEDEFGRRYDRANLHRMLGDRRYLGETPTSGPRGRRGADEGAAWISSHPPLVDRETWREAHAALASRKRGGRPPAMSARNVNFLLRGYGVCGTCGRVLIANAPMPSGSTRHGGWYRCREQHIKLARQDDVDAKLSDDMLERLEALALELAAPTRTWKPAPPPDVEAGRERVSRRRANIVSAIADGTISHADARVQLAELDAELGRLDREARRQRESCDLTAGLDARRAALRDVATLRRAWAKTTPQERREVLILLSSRVELGRDPQARPWQRGAWRHRVVWRELDQPSSGDCSPRP